MQPLSVCCGLISSFQKLYADLTKHRAFPISDSVAWQVKLLLYSTLITITPRRVGGPRIIPCSCKRPTLFRCASLERNRCNLRCDTSSQNVCKGPLPGRISLRASCAQFTPVYRCFIAALRIAVQCSIEKPIQPYVCVRHVSDIS